MPTLLQNGLPVYAVEGIGEVDLCKNGGRVILVAAAPLSGSFKANFSPKWLCHPNLEWKEISIGLFLKGMTQPLSY